MINACTVIRDDTSTIYRHIKWSLSSERTFGHEPGVLSLCRPLSTERWIIPSNPAHREEPHRTAQPIKRGNWNVKINYLVVWYQNKLFGVWWEEWYQNKTSAMENARTFLWIQVPHKFSVMAQVTPFPGEDPPNLSVKLRITDKTFFKK